MAHFISQSNEQLYDGYQGCLKSDEAIQAARAVARREEGDVVLFDDDGVWLVHPHGAADELDAADLVRLGLGDE